MNLSKWKFRKTENNITNSSISNFFNRIFQLECSTYSRQEARDLEVEEFPESRSEFDRYFLRRIGGKFSLRRIDLQDRRISRRITEDFRKDLFYFQDEIDVSRRFVAENYFSFRGRSSFDSVKVEMFRFEWNWFKSFQVEFSSWNSSWKLPEGLTLSPMTWMRVINLELASLKLEE